MGKSDEHSAPDRRAWVQGSPDETAPCTLMTPGACKIRRGCNVLQVHIQIIPLGVPKRKIKIVITCLKTILTGESQTVGNNPLRSYSPTLNPSKQPTNRSVCITVGSKIIRALEIFRVKNSYLIQFYEINICHGMIFRLYIVHNKHEMIKISN